MGQILPGLDRAQERGLQASMRNAILQNRPQHFCPLLSLVPASPAQDSRPHGMSFPTLSKKTSSRLVWAKEGIQGQTVQLNESPPPLRKGKIWLRPVVECLAGMHKTLGSIPVPHKKRGGEEEAWRIRCMGMQVSTPSSLAG